MEKIKTEKIIVQQNLIERNLKIKISKLKKITSVFLFYLILLILLSSCKESKSNRENKPKSNNNEMFYYYLPSYYYDFDNKIKISNWGGFLVLKNDLNEYLLYNDERSYSEWVENFIKAYSIATSLSEHYNLSDENLDSDSFVSKLAEINKCIKYADSMPLDENKLQDYDISYEQYDVMKEAYYDLKNIEIYEGDTGYGFTNFEYTFPGREYGYNYKRSFERYDGTRNHNIYNIDILPEGCLIFN